MILLRRLNNAVNNAMKNNIIDPFKQISCLGVRCPMDKCCRVTFAVVCLVGCAVQIYNISEIYFQYETTTLVKYRNLFDISLPAVTICMKKELLLKQELLGDVFGGNDKMQEKSDSYYKQIQNYINTFNIAQQFKMLYDSYDVFGNHCWVMRPNQFKNITDDYVECRDIVPITRSIDFYNTCFTIFDQSLNQSQYDKSRFEVDFDVSIQNYWLEIFNLKILLNISSVNLYVHSPLQRISDSFDYNMIKIHHEKGQKTCIKYHMNEVYLLPAPYITDCQNYSQDGYMSRLDCILQCKIRTLMDKYKGWPGNFLVYEHDVDQIGNQTMIDMVTEMGDNTSMDLQVVHLLYNTEHCFLLTMIFVCSIAIQVGKYCRKRCGRKPDCNKDYYFFFEAKFENKTEHKFVMDFFPPDLPNMLVAHSAKIQFEEFLCYLGSIFSLWFGFSFLMLSEIMSIGFNQFIKIFNTYKSKVKIFVYNPINFSQEMMRERTFTQSSRTSTMVLKQQVANSKV